MILADVVSSQCYYNNGSDHDKCRYGACHCPCHAECTCTCGYCRQSWDSYDYNKHEINVCHVWQEREPRV